jgi:ABC-type multidrug transport system ATPase subunit
MTIHQPNSEIFALFDKLILLVGGRSVYQGLAKDSVGYFDKMGFTCPEFSNPPDYFMSILHHESTVNVSNYQKYFDTHDK